MDATTIFALIAVTAGPVALYFLRKGEVRNNGVIVSSDHEKEVSEKREKNLNAGCDADKGFFLWKDWDDFVEQQESFMDRNSLARGRNPFNHLWYE